jgi:hypothetical protein
MSEDRSAGAVKVLTQLTAESELTPSEQCLAHYSLAKLQLRHRARAIEALQNVVMDTTIDAEHRRRSAEALASEGASTD